MCPMSMKILILGSRGRLAATLAREWGVRHEISALSRSDVDVANREALERCLGGRSFDVLVNGTGLTNVDACESRREEAHAVNAIAPAVMAAAARTCGARFIHFSTDYVFDGKKPEPYTEDDPARPLGWYGQTKIDGENAVLADSSAHRVIRVSWIFGPDKPGFVDQILQRARTTSEVSAVADKFSSPTYACDAAGWFEPFFDPALPGGLYHACNSGSCSWLEYGEWALECASASGLPVKTTKLHPQILRDMKSFTAPRPVHSILCTEKLTRITGIKPRPWREALREYITHHASIPPAC